MLQFRTRDALIVLVCLVMLACRAGGEPPAFKDRWIGGLFSKDAAQADQAVLKAFQGDIHVLSDLIKIVSSSEKFHGQFAYDDSESQVRPIGPTVGVVSMYLIQAICKEDLFFGRPYLQNRDHVTRWVDETTASALAKQEVASKAYVAWWREKHGLGFENCDFLKKTSVRWAAK